LEYIPFFTENKEKIIDLTGLTGGRAGGHAEDCGRENPLFRAPAQPGPPFAVSNFTFSEKALLSNPKMAKLLL
jgi:hypothetical protein